eukprot:TRINITY_DN43366_c0_g1_i1.p1 TRINITY_DN43366_c0_g1~~TRINITY_DN43366_c0_g1_i1.p1  ORF type:complete len:547 (+),score=58.46 TRINITY_DN43366_c0_g1_i1:62-1642(+)
MSQGVGSQPQERDVPAQVEVGRVPATDPTCRRDLNFQDFQLAPAPLESRHEGQWQSGRFYSRMKMGADGHLDQGTLEDLARGITDKQPNYARIWRDRRPNKEKVRKHQRHQQTAAENAVVPLLWPSREPYSLPDWLLDLDQWYDQPFANWPEDERASAEYIQRLSGEDKGRPLGQMVAQLRRQKWALSARTIAVGLHAYVTSDAVTLDGLFQTWMFVDSTALIDNVSICLMKAGLIKVGEPERALKFSLECKPVGTYQARMHEIPLAAAARVPHIYRERVSSVQFQHLKRYGRAGPGSHPHVIAVLGRYPAATSRVRINPPLERTRELLEAQLKSAATYGNVAVVTKLTAELASTDDTPNRASPAARERRLCLLRAHGACGHTTVGDLSVAWRESLRVVPPTDKCYSTYITALLYKADDGALEEAKSALLEAVEEFGLTETLQLTAASVAQMCCDPGVLNTLVPSARRLSGELPVAAGLAFGMPPPPGVQRGSQVTVEPTPWRGRAPSARTSLATWAAPKMRRFLH